MLIEISLAVLAGVLFMFLYGFIFEALGGEEAFVSEEQKRMYNIAKTVMEQNNVVNMSGSASCLDNITFESNGITVSVCHVLFDPIITMQNHYKIYIDGVGEFFGLKKSYLVDMAVRKYDRFYKENMNKKMESMENKLKEGN